MQNKTSILAVSGATIGEAITMSATTAESPYSIAYAMSISRTLAMAVALYLSLLYGSGYAALAWSVNNQLAPVSYPGKLRLRNLIPDWPAGSPGHPAYRPVMARQDWTGDAGLCLRPVGRGRCGCCLSWLAGISRLHDLSGRDKQC
jgi:hypothetical protein